MERSLRRAISLTSSDLDPSENRADDVDILRILIVKFFLNGSLNALFTNLNKLISLLNTTFGDNAFDDSTICVACKASRIEM